MSVRTLAVKAEKWPLADEFRIARGAKTQAEVVVAEIEEDGLVGRGECVPYARYGESINEVVRTIRNLTPAVTANAPPNVQSLAAPGAARNALDCAWIDLMSKKRGVPARTMLALPQAKPAICAYTLSIRSPDAMAQAALDASVRLLLKLKLAGDGDDVARVKAVHAARPDAHLIVDANEGLDIAGLEALTAVGADCNVRLIEQPLPAEADEALEGFDSPVPLCADESVHSRADLDAVSKRYHAVNVKLDKAGGLTEAAFLAREAKDRELMVMIGCMVGTSLAMAPAFVLQPLADFIDLDGPLLLAHDRPHAIEYEGALMHPPERALWG